MVRADPGGPNRAEIGKLGFEAFDVEPQRGVAGKDQRDDPGRRIGFGELDREQVQHGIRVVAADISAFDRAHPVEPQCRAAAPKVRGFVLRRWESMADDTITLVSTSDSAEQVLEALTGKPETKAPEAKAPETPLRSVRRERCSPAFPGAHARRLR